VKIKDVHKWKLPYQYKIKGLNWVLNRFVKFTENRLIRQSGIAGAVRPNANCPPVIVSLTTYPARSQKVQWTIKSLLNQSVPFDRLIIWLAEDQYPEQKIPSELEQFLSYNVEIRFCEDLRSHKKYYYTMKENPDAIVITVDDDVIYPEDTVEKLLSMNRTFPDAVICNQGRWIGLEHDNFASYEKWTVSLPQNINKPDYRILPIGEGGVLYPPGCLDEEVFNRDNIRSMAFSADDLWLKFMAVKNKRKAMVSTKVQRAPSEVVAENSEDLGLNAQNLYQGRNNQVISDLNDHYAEVLKRIIREE
jgi:hypothetical protein